ncbi:hypothetical protein [Actinomadura napierensis]|uniref:hypothetical protein n=1 Tax=Actinomadura napierensis TaxID=267854 RepID=UPI0031DDF7A7
MQVDLRDQRWSVGTELVVAVGVGAKDSAFGVVVAERAVQAAEDVVGVLAGHTLAVGPPTGQIGPGQPVRGQGPVVDQAVADDAQVVVDGVVEHDLGLGADGGEDEVLQRPGYP